MEFSLDELRAISAYAAQDDNYDLSEKVDREIERRKQKKLDQFLNAQTNADLGSSLVLLRGLKIHTTDVDEILALLEKTLLFRGFTV